MLAVALIQVNMRPKSQAWPVKDGEDRFAISGCSRKRQEQARAPRQIRRDSTGANQASRAELITAALGAMVLAHRERFERRKTQREMAADRLQPGGHPGTLPNPGVYARHNAVDVPGRLPLILRPSEMSTWTCVFSVRNRRWLSGARRLPRSAESRCWRLFSAAVSTTPFPNFQNLASRCSPSRFLSAPPRATVRRSGGTARAQ